MSSNDQAYEDLEVAYKNFMSKLQDDIQLHLGKDVPFMIRVDIKLGVEQKNEKKIKIYEPKLNKLINSLPKEIKPVEATGGERLFATHVVDKKEPEEME